MISSSSAKGGGPRHISLLSKYLPKNVLVYYAMPFSKNIERQKIYLENSNYLKIRERNVNFFDLINLIKFINLKKIQIIHAHGKGASIIARILSLICKKPLVYTYHGIHLKCHSRLNQIIYLIYEYFFGFIDTYKVFVSESEKDYASKKRFLNKRFKVINNGVETKRGKIKNTRILEKYNIKEKDKIVITVARLVEQKNIFEVINIAKKLPKIKFLILGGGVLLEELMNYKAANKVNNLIFTGEINNIYKFLKISDVYLSTSIYEGHPIGILEGMSVGLPIVASNVIGNKDTIENKKSGYFYSLGNIDEACKYINKIVRNPLLRDKLGNQALIKQRKNFTANLMAKKYYSLYENLCLRNSIL